MQFREKKKPQTKFFPEIDCRNGDMGIFCARDGIFGNDFGEEKSDVKRPARAPESKRARKD